jgi:hypothetical protein
MRRLLVLFSAVLICCLPVIMVNAQSAATITGQVVDPQGAVITNATVTATNVATGVAHSAKTTSSGNYTIPNLPPGTYDVKVEAAKFAVGETKGIKLNVGDQRDLGFKLGVAGSTESIEVTTTAPLIETTKTDVSTSVTDLDMQKLPTFAPASGGANDFAQLALTAPGVKADPTLTGDLVGPGSVNNRGNLYNVDGANITDQMVSGRDGLGASLDEIQEFQVLTNNYNAEYGQAGGLIVNAVTKSGTNQVHGEGHMLFRGRNFAASDAFYDLNLIPNAVPRSAPPSAGGPRCPDSDFSGGVLTSFDGCDRAPFHRKEGGFTVGGPFIKDKLFWFGSYELSRQSTPLSISTPTTANTVQQPANNLLWSGKLDYHISSNHNLSFRYNVDRLLQDNLVVQTGTNITPDSLVSSVTHVNGINTGLVSSITPNLINEAHFFFGRTLTATPDKTTVPGQQHPGFYTGAAFCCPQGGLQKRYQYSDSLTWTHGKHAWKGGFNISYFPWFSLFQQFHFGQWGDFTGPTTPGSFTFGSGPGAVTSKDNIYGFFFQDTWKLRRNVTVNYGIRYDYEAGAFKGGTIKGPNGTCFQSNGLISACSSDKNNWQPRLGITWEVRPGTLVKASAAEVTMLAFNNVVLDSLNFDGHTLNTTTVTSSDPGWASVAAAFPNSPSPALLASLVPPGSGFFGRVRPISPNLHNPELRMFNLSVQHQFTKTLVAEAQYIGQFGFGLFGERDTNAAPVIADPAHPGFFYFGDRPNPHFTAIRTNENSRTSHYNGMLLSASKRMSNHVQFNASYTWSHALTSSEDFFGLSEPGDPRNIRAELGPALNDIRHAANFGVVLDSGKATDRNIVRWFTNDLTLGIIGQLQSGRPYPFSTGTAGFANGRFFGNGNETQQRPNVLPDGTISVAAIASAFGANALFGPGAVAACVAGGFSAAQCASIKNTFLAPGTASSKGAVDALTGDIVDFKFVNGNVERNAGRGAPFLRNDVSLKKQFRIANRERLRLELEADAINVFNHSNFLGFNSNNDTANLSFGTVSATAPAGTGLFDCTNCIRPNGTLVGTGGQILHLSDVTHGTLSKDLLKPTYGVFGGSIGDPAISDGPRKFQLAFRVRF